MDKKAVFRKWLKNLVHEMDRDNDGIISHDEFLELLNRIHEYAKEECGEEEADDVLKVNKLKS